MGSGQQGDNRDVSRVNPTLFLLSPGNQSPPREPTRDNPFSILFSRQERELARTDRLKHQKILLQVPFLPLLAGIGTVISTRLPAETGFVTSSETVSSER